MMSKKRANHGAESTKGSSRHTGAAAVPPDRNLCAGHCLGDDVVRRPLPKRRVAWHKACMGVHER